MPQEFSTIEQALRAIAAGKVVVVVDAEERENEGDFICAAELATTETINFMLHGKGQLCVSILPDVAQRCQLRPVVVHNDAPLSTAFLTPIDHRSNRTGITAGERATTIRELVATTSQAADFVRPGHVFPLLSQPGGVLVRPGHTEAAMDLARLAGCTPAGVLCEILDAEGERPSREALFDIAHQNNLAIISIEQLIAHRQRMEPQVRRVAHTELSTPHGRFQVIAYQLAHSNQQPLAVVLGDLSAARAPHVEVRPACMTQQLLSLLQGQMETSFQSALAKISHDGVGAIVYLPHTDQPSDTIQAWRAAKTPASRQTNAFDRTIGRQILDDLGVRPHCSKAA